MRMHERIKAFRERATSIVDRATYTFSLGLGESLTRLADRSTILACMGNVRHDHTTACAQELDNTQGDCAFETRQPPDSVDVVRNSSLPRACIGWSRARVH